MTPIFLNIGKKTSKKVKFTEAEDKQIIALVGNNFDTVNWELVALALGNRTPRQCKDRYHSYLAPGLNKNKWSEEEDKKLLELVSTYGQKWKMLAPSFNGRPEVSLKNRFRLLQRRKEKKERLEKERAPLQEKVEPAFNPLASTVGKEQESFIDDSLFENEDFFNTFSFDEPNQFYFF